MKMVQWLNCSMIRLLEWRGYLAAGLGLSLVTGHLSLVKNAKDK